MPATIADVASLAGVGRGTVSRVLNDRPNVDPTTRDRVRAAIAVLDYVPSPIARRLSLGRTQTIGVVVPYMTTASVVERLQGIEAALVPAGYDMIVFNVESVERRDAVFRDVPRRERVDGLIVVSISPRVAEIARIQAAGVPLVLVDVDHRGVASVVVDDVHGGYLAAEHLLALGHRHIAFLGDRPRLALGFRSSRRRLQGLTSALRAAAVPFPTSRIATGEHDRSTAGELTRRLLALSDPPTAIVCASDNQAFGAIEAIRALGADVPSDVSVIG
ncbi:MAG: LacI family DNA-binding transcriptional regulator [Candidatus Limnocylindrales bacterium]